MKKLSTYIIAILSCIYVNAQQSFTNSGNLQIHTGASVSGSGNFTNTSSAVLINNGSFYVKGNISNDQSSMAAGTGTLYLNGSAAQSVNGSQTFKTYNLVTNNTAGITLNNNLSVNAVHTFTSGLITTSSIPNYLVYEAGSSYTGDNDSRHVNGWVKKYGTTNFIFPVGDTTYERVVGISNLSASSEINCTYNRPTGNTINLFSPLAMVKANEYWQMDKISGGTAQVTLNWDHSKVAMDNVLLIDILSSQYSAGYWRSTGGTASGNVTTTGTITSNALGSFGPLTFGYTAYPVPLKLLSFTAVRTSGTSFLNWVTENEQNVDHFDVQRSYDGNSFTTIGHVAARNSGSREVYDFEDHSALNGIAYYRIKSIDVDQKFSYSKIAAVSEYDQRSTNFVVLNPARNFITILNKSGEEGAFNYFLYNAAGQLSLKGNTNMGINGGVALPLPANISAGIYMLELSNGKIQFQQKILVEK
ncbi:MAG TPA: T9SS type A sorting domain-containing protein [Chitinophagaceae bacterium]|nr:T9SS type A sorting domain-containing protein [Chitinophagaceae bacterium]